MSGGDIIDTEEAGSTDKRKSSRRNSRSSSKKQTGGLELDNCAFCDSDGDFVIAAMNKFMADQEDESKPAPPICMYCDEEMELRQNLLQREGVERDDYD